MQSSIGDRAPQAAPRGRLAIVLAAGSSSRMGSPKALLPWARTTLLGYAIRELRAAGASSVFVVVGADAQQVVATLPEDPAVIPVENPGYAEGRSSSIRAGVAALPAECRSVIIQSVDQPCPRSVAESLYLALEASGAYVAMPVFGGRRGHPVCLSGRLVPELAAIREEDQGLRAVVRRHGHSIREVSVESEVIHLNLNDPAAFEAATLLFDSHS